MRQQGFSCLDAWPAREALLVLTRTGSVLPNLMLPGVDGQRCAQLKEHSDAAVIVLSPKTVSKARWNCCSRADDYATKPFALEELAGSAQLRDIKTTTMHCGSMI
ncbi:MAG: hypothetical protein ACLVJ6_01015 [Merdibacter sp.]